MIVLLEQIYDGFTEDTYLFIYHYSIVKLK